MVACFRRTYLTSLRQTTDPTVVDRPSTEMYDKMGVLRCNPTKWGIRMIKKWVLSLIGFLIVVVGWIFLDGSGGFLPSAGKLLSAGNIVRLAPKHKAWTVNEETTTSGPWTGRMQMLYKPDKPIYFNHHAVARFDVVVSEALEYHGMFPPTLLKWPDMAEWPKTYGAPSQGPPIRPMKLKSGTFLYANYGTDSPTQFISLAQLHKAFSTASFIIVWRSDRSLPFTQFWGIGPVHTRVLSFTTSLP